MRLVLDLQGASGGTQGNEEARLVADEYIKAFDLYVSKNVTYGGAWAQQGWMGNLGRILSKASRLRSMLWGDITMSSADEPVDDTALDIMNLVVFFRINRARFNKWGERA